MKSKLFPKIAATLAVAFIFFIWGFLAMQSAQPVYADDTCQPGDSTCKPPQTVKLNVTLVNPIEANDFQEFLAKVIHIMYLIGIPITAIMIIWSGFLFVTAGGDTGKIKTARETFLWTVVGAAILLGAEVISSALIETVKKL